MRREYRPEDYFPSIPGLRVSKEERASYGWPEVVTVVKVECQTCGKTARYEDYDERLIEAKVKGAGWLAEDTEYGVECGPCRTNPYRHFQLVTL